MLKHLVYRLKGWRTRLSNAVFGVLGVVALVDPQLWAGVVPVKYQGAALLLSALVNIALRQVTTTPPGRRAP
ncbi:hypothetical protein [Rhodobium gokarnense]|uniref:Holin n=1 Tax=Rhodobium gokarnense TaxID=364296 RepID=A0ABT3HH95_9HYPH|nr:hypothetical protein [Rhodobium gokarnense]MCW2309752.1 hypothetical protein [Rhodobium gokarnense]